MMIAAAFYVRGTPITHSPQGAADAAASTDTDRSRWMGIKRYAIIFEHQKNQMDSGRPTNRHYKGGIRNKGAKNTAICHAGTSTDTAHPTMTLLW
jgi:hypothetical protein